jgi:hypothetical protein
LLGFVQQAAPRRVLIQRPALAGAHGDSFGKLDRLFPSITNCDGADHVRWHYRTYQQLDSIETSLVFACLTASKK